MSYIIENIIITILWEFLNTSVNDFMILIKGLALPCQLYTYKLLANCVSDNIFIFSMIKGLFSSIYIFFILVHIANLNHRNSSYYVYTPNPFLHTWWHQRKKKAEKNQRSSEITIRIQDVLECKLDVGDTCFLFLTFNLSILVGMSESRFSRWCFSSFRLRRFSESRRSNFQPPSPSNCSRCVWNFLQVTQKIWLSNDDMQLLDDRCNVQYFRVQEYAAIITFCELVAFIQCLHYISCLTFDQSTKQFTLWDCYIEGFSISKGTWSSLYQECHTQPHPFQRSLWASLKWTLS